MVNIGLLLGTSYIGEDVRHKLPWVRHLDERHRVFVASRINPEVHFKEPDLTEPLRQHTGVALFTDIKTQTRQLLEQASGFSMIYDSPCLKKRYAPAQIEELQRWLGVSFGFVASFDRRFYDNTKLTDKRSSEDLKNFAAGLVTFFEDFYSRNRISVFVNTLEDNLFSTIPYYVARRMGIEVLGLLSSKFPKRGVTFCKDFTDECVWNDSDPKWDDIAALYEESTIAGTTLMNRNREMFSFSSIPSLKDIRKEISLARFMDRTVVKYPLDRLIIERKGFWFDLKKYLKTTVRRSLVRKYLHEPDFSESYFLFPLHFVADAQITFREPLLDQFALIKAISRAMPSDYCLYVKPHPHYLGTDNKLPALAQLSKLSNVKIIAPEAPPVKLIRCSEGVITVNSTAGFEALILNKPVVTFGHDVYCKPYLTYVVRDVNELSEVLVQLINAKKLPDREAVKRFIKKSYANAIFVEGYDGSDYRNSGFTDRDGQLVAFAFNRILGNLDFREAGEGQIDTRF